MTDEVDWSGDRWAELLEKSIRDAAGPDTTVELRRINPRMVLICADPGDSAGASLEIVVGVEELQVFVADVLNAEFSRPRDEQEVDALVRGVTQHGCRVIKSGFRRYVEIGPCAIDEGAPPFKIERAWTSWSSAGAATAPEWPLRYRV